MTTKPIGTNHSSHMDQLTRLKRIEGQVRGVMGMVERGEYCIDIISQLKAARSALLAVESKVMSKHIKHCLKNALSTEDNTLVDEKIDEIVALMAKMSK